MSEAEIAWAAGLFEGEGCITISTGRGGYQQPRLKLNMIDGEIVDRFHAVVGRGRTCPERPRRPNHQPQTCWYTGKRADVRYVLELLLPWLGERRSKRASEVLALCPPAE